jgi:hypothetical protein
MWNPFQEGRRLLGKFCKLVSDTYYNILLFTVLMRIKHKYIYRDLGLFCRKVSPLANGVDIYGSPSFLDLLWTQKCMNILSALHFC